MMERINKKAQIRALTVKRIVFAGLLLTLLLVNPWIIYRLTDSWLLTNLIITA